jgi:hypothetical protein
VIIRDIYKIIVYFAKLDLTDVPVPGDTYKSKLGDLQIKKNNLLQKLLNDPAADLWSPKIDSDDDDNIDAQIALAAGAAGGAAIFNRDDFLNHDSQETAQYMSNVLNALGEFRKILVDFKGSLQTDLNRASGVIIPGTGGGITQADLDAASEAAKAEGKAEAERKNAEDDAAEAAAAEKEEKDGGLAAGAVAGVLAVGIAGLYAAYGG